MDDYEARVQIAQLEAELDRCYEWLDDARNREVTRVRALARMEVEKYWAEEAKADDKVCAAANEILLGAGYPPMPPKKTKKTSKKTPRGQK